MIEKPPLTHGRFISQQVNNYEHCLAQEHSVYTTHTLLAHYTHGRIIATSSTVYFLISGAFASTIGYYAKLMRRTTLPSLGAVRIVDNCNKKIVNT